MTDSPAPVFPPDSDRIGKRQLAFFDPGILRKIIGIWKSGRTPQKSGPPNPNLPILNMWLSPLTVACHWRRADQAGVTPPPIQYRSRRTRRNETRPDSPLCHVYQPYLSATKHIPVRSRSRSDVIRSDDLVPERLFAAQIDIDHPSAYTGLFQSPTSSRTVYFSAQS